MPDQYDILHAITVYGRPNCSYCDKAKELLKSKGISYNYYELGKDFTVEKYQELFPGRRTVPGITVAGIPLGGYEDLVEYFVETSGLSDDLQD